MRRQVTVVVALALQLLGCSAPANAFILCISEDGCVELELAAPGTDRCQERNCDAAHAGDGHGCSDIPVLGDALGPLRAALGEHGATDGAALLPLLHDAPAAPAPRITGRAPDAALASSAPPRRTVVLQL